MEYDLGIRMASEIGYPKPVIWFHGTVSMREAECLGPEIMEVRYEGLYSGGYSS